MPDCLFRSFSLTFILQADLENPFDGEGLEDVYFDLPREVR